MTRYFTDNCHHLLPCVRGSGRTSRAAARKRVVWAIPPSTDSSCNCLLHAPLSTCGGATLYFMGGYRTGKCNTLNQSVIKF